MKAHLYLAQLVEQLLQTLHYQLTIIQSIPSHPLLCINDPNMDEGFRRFATIWLADDGTITIQATMSWNPSRTTHLANPDLKTFILTAIRYHHHETIQFLKQRPLTTAV